MRKMDRGRFSKFRREKICLFSNESRKNGKLGEKEKLCLYAYTAFSTHGKDYSR